MFDETTGGTHAAAAGAAASGAGFAAQAEALRRAGQPEQAERIAREGLADTPGHVAGRIALGLALLDQGRLREARRHFEQVVDAQAREPAALPFGDAVGVDELERAFEGAEAELETMIDANDVAEAALRGLEDEEAAPHELVPDPASPLATHTIAALLERQGEREAALRVRAAAAARATGATGPTTRAGGTRPMRQRRIQTLERWLGKLHGRRA